MNAIVPDTTYVPYYYNCRNCGCPLFAEIGVPLAEYGADGNSAVRAARLRKIGFCIHCPISLPLRSSGIGAHNPVLKDARALGTE